MDTTGYPRVWPQLIPALEAALQRHEQASINFAAFKKSYASAKNKVKRTEKYLSTLDEDSQKWYGYGILKPTRLAKNKLILIDKKLKRFRAHEERYCKASLKVLRAPVGMEPNMTTWHIQRVADYPYAVSYLLSTVNDMLRIANRHLTNVDDAKKRLVMARKRGWIK
ncbi:MAG: hypothetical protein K9J17_14365 [Flavobacteriales bacterium]|nr:hypothetical protein [Flavobacteriales bacterium]